MLQNQAVINEHKINILSQNLMAEQEKLRTTTNQISVLTHKLSNLTNPIETLENLLEQGNHAFRNLEIKYSNEQAENTILRQEIEVLKQAAAEDACSVCFESVGKYFNVQIEFIKNLLSSMTSIIECPASNLVAISSATNVPIRSFLVKNCVTNAAPECLRLTKYCSFINS